MRDHIIDLLSLGGRHTRSIAIDRDLNHDDAIAGYLPTPNAIAALKQIGEGIEAGRSQRAWKLVGPYGSGKSALAVMLGQLLAGPVRHPVAAHCLAEAAPKVARAFSKANRLALPVVGSRVSFGLALATSIDTSLVQFGKSKAATSLRRQLDLEGGIYKHRPLNASSGELAADFAAVARSEGYDGVVLLIDEVGKFVEYAALHPELGDLIALQQVAENACRPNDDSLVVVAMLHQHFASYAAGVGRALNDEWHKVAARFEEVPFDEPVERYAHFARHALGCKPKLLSNKDLVATARSAYAAALTLGILRAPSAEDKKLFEHPEHLYPLHPLTVAAMATVAKRYGQSERSFHAFLKGNEPLGLRHFAERTSPSPQAWYRLPELYDYLSEGNGLRFRDLGAERRWAFAQTSVERLTEDLVATQVLKTIAVLELVQSGLGIRVSPEIVAFALDDTGTAQLTAALTRLVEQGVLIKRRKESEYSLAVSDAVNIEALFDRAAKTSEGELIVSGISKVLSQRLVVANRHYDATGTIRTLGLLVGSPEAWPEIPSGKSDEVRPDAWLKLVLVTKDSDAAAIAIKRLQDERDNLSLGGCLALTAESRAALIELAVWQIVLREVASKRLDPWTSRYVEGRLQDASDVVERLVTSTLTPTVERPGLTYWYQGASIPDSELMNASQLASWLFDKVYSETPCIVNELINKDRPTSAIVLARQRLFDVLLSGDPTKKICGDSEYPPERLIHTTLLRDTGIWKEADGQWKLQAPTRAAARSISPVWTEISLQLASEKPRTFAEILDALAAPPLGVRAGPAGVWVVLYLLINRGQCAVFERNTLLLELTAEHLQRMFKNPQTFTLRELADAESSKKLLSDYRFSLASVGSSLEASATYLDVARALYRWFTRLPDFTKQTLQVGKEAALMRSMLGKATDPIELLTHTLPQAHLEAKSKESFSKWLAAALADLGMAHRRLQENVSTELSKGFGINGPLTRVRNQLQAECTKEASKLADAKLKSFILRCTDLLLTDERWLDSVGSLVVQRPLDSWTDDTLSAFQEGLTDLCGRYKRWMQVVMHRGEAPLAADRFVGLTLTLPGGEEASVFVATTEESMALAQDFRRTIERSAKGDRNLAAAALAQALLELQIEFKNSEQEGVNHG